VIGEVGQTRSGTTTIKNALVECILHRRLETELGVALTRADQLRAFYVDATHRNSPGSRHRFEGGGLVKSFRTPHLLHTWET